MKLDLEVIAEEIVKPSSPTADRLRCYRLSFRDQVSTSLYNHLVYFYRRICDAEANKTKFSDKLKHSISDALVYFYPLAGRMTEDQLFVDCNDKGISFVEARVKCQLSRCFEQSSSERTQEVASFRNPLHQRTSTRHQIQCFRCGGIGIGVCVSHKIGDALSFFSFVKTWAAIARGETKFVAPIFESALVFPPRHQPGYVPKASEFKGLVTSLCRFPLYEADFGWGKPIWAATGHRELKNTAVFLDTITGDGLEA